MIWFGLEWPGSSNTNLSWIHIYPLLISMDETEAVPHPI
jgi:hypothetical protein